MLCSVFLSISIPPSISLTQSLRKLSLLMALLQCAFFSVSLSLSFSYAKLTKLAQAFSPYGSVHKHKGE
jgi:hypothetical protein